MKSKSFSYVRQARNVTHTVARFGTCSGTDIVNYTVPSYIERSGLIEYDIGRRKTNRCKHITVVQSRNTGTAIGVAQKASLTGCKATETYPADLLYEPNVHSVIWPAIELADPRWRSYSSQAIQSMWPEVETRVSLANTLVELPEVLTLTKAIEALESVFKRFGTSMRRLAAIKKGRPLRDLIKGLSGGALLSEFALRPLLLDLIGVADVFTHARKDVERLLSNEGKPLVSHFRRRLDITSSRTDTAVFFSDSNGHHLSTREITVSDAWYNATMRYSYRLLDYQRKQAYQLGRWDALGLNLNPSIIWNAIPWSFVVDWFARVGDFLDQAKIRNIEPLVSIDSFCHSYKVEYLYVHSMHMRANRPGSSGNTRTGTYRTRIYMREPYIPDTYTAIKLSGVNTREFILGAALLGVRR